MHLVTNISKPPIDIHVKAWKFQYEMKKMKKRQKS
jgi:hypothetical protein